MLQKENLRGQVKTVHITNGYEQITTWYDPAGRIIRREQTTPEGRRYVRKNYRYDKRNRPLSFSEEQADKPTPDNTCTYTYTYDEQGLLESFRFDYQNGASREIWYEYDASGNCIRETGDYLYPDIKKIYNDQGQLIETITHRPGHQIHSWGEDESGEHWERDEFIPPREIHTFYEYNERGDVSRVVQTNSSDYGDDYDDTSTDELTYTYDAQGNWIERRQSNPMSVYIHNPLYEYDFSSSSFLMTRTIEYYDDKSFFTPKQY